jgi:hypothetical protein
MNKRIIKLVVCLVLPIYSIAQDDLNDFNTWTVVQVKYERIKKWDFYLEGQLRLKENSSTIDTYFGEVGFEYKLPRNFDIGAGFRYIRDNDNQGNIQGYENHFRFNFDLSYKHDINRLRLKYRLRYQNRNELGRDDIANQRIRIKTTTVYNFRKWKLDPELSAEIFSRVEKNGDNNGFDKFRIGLGTSYNLKKIGKFSLFYFYENEFNVTNPELLNIIRFKYSYSID